MLTLIFHQIQFVKHKNQEKPFNKQMNEWINDMLCSLFLEWSDQFPAVHYSAVIYDSNIHNMNSVLLLP